MSAEAINQAEISIRQSVGNFINAHKMEALGVAMTASLALGGTACSGEGQESASGTSTPGTEQVTTTEATGINGDITAGDDATIRAEDDAGRYECGGAKNETWLNADGTVKTFSADVSLIPHMNRHKDLAVSDQNWQIDLMGQSGFKYLAVNAYSNNEHDEVNSDLDVPEASADYEDFIEKQVATVVLNDAVVENHGCLKPDGSYEVYGAGLKHIMRERTGVTGLVLSDDKYPGFVEAVEAEGKDLDDMLIQDVDTNGDKVMDAKHIATKLRECANNIKLTDIAVPVTVEETTPATGGPTTTRGGYTTTTRGGNTTTTGVTPSTRPELGVSPNSSVVDGPGTPNTTDSDNNPDNNTTTSIRSNPTTTGSTIVVTVPTTGPESPTTVTTVIAG